MVATASRERALRARIWRLSNITEAFATSIPEGISLSLQIRDMRSPVAFSETCLSSENVRARRGTRNCKISGLVGCLLTKMFKRSIIRFLKCTASLCVPSGMSINLSSLYKTREHTFVLLPFYPILEHQCKFVIHRHHLIIIEFPLRLFISHFRHVNSLFCLESFCDVRESLILCLITFAVLNPSGGYFVLFAAVSRIPG